MPTLDWIGKKAVIRHHAEVPFHLLKEEPALSCGSASRFREFAFRLLQR